MDKISFQGLTNFSISPTAYRKVANITREKYTNLHIGTNCRLTKNKVCTIETDPKNLTLIVRNKKDGFYKYIPLIDNLDYVIADITKGIEQLKKTAADEPLTAWLVGGTKLDGRQGNKVADTFNKIADVVCDRPDMDTSILIGSHTGEEMFTLHLKPEQLNLSLDKTVNQGNSVQSELENIFDIVDLNNTHLSHEI